MFKSIYIYLYLSIYLSIYLYIMSPYLEVSEEVGVPLGVGRHVHVAHNHHRVPADHKRQPGKESETQRPQVKGTEANTGAVLF
jgi:hypothetical protein